MNSFVHFVYLMSWNNCRLCAERAFWICPL